VGEIAVNKVNSKEMFWELIFFSALCVRFGKKKKIFKFKKTSLLLLS